MTFKGPFQIKRLYDSKGGVGVATASPIWELEDLHWWHRKDTGVIASPWGVVGLLHSSEIPCVFLLFTEYDAGEMNGVERENNCKNVFVMFCRYAYSLLENHIVSLS